MTNREPKRCPSRVQGPTREPKQIPSRKRDDNPRLTRREKKEQGK